MRTMKIAMIVMSTMMVAFLLWNLTLSGDYKSVATAEFDVSANALHDEFADLRNWEDWTTFLQRDSNMTVIFSSPSSGERAYMDWKMESGAGGRLEIEKTSADSVQYLLSLPGWAASRATAKVEEMESGSKLTWTVRGELPFYARFMRRTFEKMIREDFERSLDNLRTHLSE